MAQQICVVLSAAAEREQVTAIVAGAIGGANRSNALAALRGFSAQDAIQWIC